jgi:catechol 2,3-dioxygenase-like lactoylglutathione lyase family enzyme
MPLLRMEHYLVLSEDIEKTKDFYCNALGLRNGFRPDLDFAGYWLYLGDTPCIHVGDWDEYEVWTRRVGIPFSPKANGTGPVDHIAFNATGYEETCARLRELGLEWSQNSLEDIGLKQLFLHDPNGVAIELNFRT